MLTLMNKDIREYRVLDLPYHFVLFHHIPLIPSMMYMQPLGGNEEDNAILTYCYLDRRAGLSYRAICCAKLSADGMVAYHADRNPSSSLIIREGGLECPAEVIDEDDADMQRFRDVADLVKKRYGYHREMTEIRKDVPFAEYRHPACPDDVRVVFMTPDSKLEFIWVREKERRGEGIVGVLLNEPFDPQMQVHEGDSVEVIPLEKDGQVIPFAMPDWAKRKWSFLMP